MSLKLKDVIEGIEPVSQERRAGVSRSALGVNGR